MCLNTAHFPRQWAAKPWTTEENLLEGVIICRLPRQYVKGLASLCNSIQITGTIKMIFNDNDRHHKPHVHVYYGEYEASVGLDGEVLEGKLPVKQYRILTGWMALHEDELYAAWNNAVRQLPFERIDPLS